ncbi:MAG TPA: RsmB/NOP family class I SAM-dependent RNA methyltransferase [Candidatus Dojkabacteria bacterium]|nr:RsmB/NOP family class I SAM-dependent RNA methyltransferase [Candidatus Dojkabacteria bacterium]
MQKKSNIKRKMKTQKKYYSKLDVFLSRIASILKVSTGNVMKAFTERAVTTIRLNNLSNEPERTYEMLKDMGADLVAVPWAPNTYIVPNMDKTDLANTVMYKQGFFYIQNLASMLPAIILDPKPDEIILDMCAAPGSKTTQLAAMLRNKGKIIANDDDKFRGDKLKQMLHMFNVKNTDVRFGKGEAIGKREENHYDKILLDAPCSGEGLIYLKGEKPLRFWNVKKVKGMAKVQKELIVSAFNALKKGGLMVYSTCTLEPDEDEAIVTYLLEKFDNARLEDIELFRSENFKEDHGLVKRGLHEYNGQKFNESVGNTYRITPSSKMMGFYLALIKKV